MRANPQNVTQCLGELLGAGLVALAVREAFRRAWWDLAAAAGMVLLRVAARALPGSSRQQLPRSGGCIEHH